MTTITWTISALDCAPLEAGKTNVVKTVHWSCTGVDGAHAGTIYATCALPPPGQPFVDYAELTQDKVLGWVWANGVNKAATEAAVQKQIDNQINPPVIRPPLPWATPAA